MERKKNQSIFLMIAVFCRIYGEKVGYCSNSKAGMSLDLVRSMAWNSPTILISIEYNFLYNVFENIVH